MAYLYNGIPCLHYKKGGGEVVLYSLIWKNIQDILIKNKIKL